MKEILKPTRSKLIVALIITVFIGWISIVYGVSSETCSRHVDSGCVFHVHPVLWAPTYFLNYTVSFPKRNYSVNFTFLRTFESPPLSVVIGFLTFVTIPYWLLISYLISCAGIAVYYRVKYR